MIISGDTKNFIADSDQDQSQTPGTTDYPLQIFGEYSRFDPDVLILLLFRATILNFQDSRRTLIQIVAVTLTKLTEYQGGLISR